MGAPTLVGLDIGSMYVRAVEITRGKDGPTVTNFGRAMLPEGAMQAGVITDDKAVTLTLKQLWSSTKFRSKKVVLGVTNPQVVVREMAVSNLPERELHASLPFQVRDMLPLSVDRSLLDFYRLEDPGTAETVRGLLIAAPRDAVLTAVQAIERAGLHVARVDLGSFALLRSASRLDEQVEAIVDIGARSTSMVVHNNGEPLFVRTIPRGGAEITEIIATRLGIPVAEAESLKCRVGLHTDDEPDAAAVIRETVRPLISEIRSSFAYLTAGGRQTRVCRVVLSGGGALLPGLVDALGAQLDIPVLLADPTLRLRDRRRGKPGGREPLDAAAAVSVGLTLAAT